MRAPMLLVTGATGFVGRAFLREAGGRAGGVRALVRGGAAARSLPPGVEPALGDLADERALEAAARGVAVVVHLAARTGKARAAEHDRVNARGTERLLRTARSAGVRGFLLASSIAATYADKRGYPYAASKERAEEAVRASGLPWAILRPTVVLGPGSPAGAALARLARLPRVPVFGDGRAPVQPVHVDDVARGLALLAERLETRALTEGAFDLGGPEALPFEELLLRLARVLRGRPARAVRVPLAPLRALLGALEPLLLPVLPLTAGQLLAFANDGRAREGDLARDLAPLRGLDAMLEELAGGPARG